MGQINAAVNIPAAPEAVWEAIATPSSYENWLTIHTKWKEAPERYSAGANATEVVTMLGMPNTITWTVETFEENSQLKVTGTGMAGVQTTFEFGVAPDGNGGTTASVRAEFVGAMIVGALGKAVEADGEKNLQNSLAKLGELVA
jgi:uncharacterized protein YndB with AHSA1/START domain